MRIRGYDEDTKQLSEDVMALTGKIADFTKTAKHPIGISLFTDETKETYKSPVQLLREISKIYDELSDKQQAGLLEALGGKRGGQAVAAALNNFDAVEKSLDTMSKSAGNAEKEMGVIMDSIEYKTNRLKETAVGIAQDIFQRDSTKNMVDNLTSLLEIINKLITSVGGLGTALTGLMAYKGLKGQGIFDIFGTGVSGVKGVQNFFTQRQLSEDAITLGITSQDISLLTSYDNLLKTNAQDTVALQNAMQGMSQPARNFATQMQTGAASVEMLTTASKAAQIGMKLLNSAMNISITLAVSYAISQLVQKMDELIVTEEEARQKHEELIQTIENNIEQHDTERKELQSIVKEYEKYKDVTTYTAEQKEQLKSIQDQLIEQYGAEANGIDLVNGKYEEQIQHLTELERHQAKIANSEYWAIVNEKSGAYKENTGYSWEQYYTAKQIGYEGKAFVDRKPVYDKSDLQKALDGLFDEKSMAYKYDKYTEEAEMGVTFSLKTVDENGKPLDAKQMLSQVEKIQEKLNEIRLDPSVEMQNVAASTDFIELQEQVALWVEHYRNEVDEYNGALTNLAKNIVQTQEVIINGKSYYADTISEGTYQTYRTKLIKAYQKSDPELADAIAKYLDDTYGKAFGQSSISDYERAKAMFGTQEITRDFAYADYKERIDEVEKSLGKLASAYSKLKSEEMTSSDVLSLIDEFPELAPYANDMSALTDKVKELGQQTAEPLITSLNALAKNVKDPEQKASIEALVINLQKMASLSEGIKKTADAVQKVTAADYIKWEEDNIQKIIDKLEKEKDSQNDVLDSLKQQKETLEQTISDYEKVADVVGKYIDRTQIEPLNDRKTEIEEYYNTEIEKLKEENDERDRNIELQEKQDALANARKQKNRVYTETEGWVWKQNNKAIRDAQKDLTDLQNTMSIESLEKTRDAEVKTIDEQIKSWEKYKDEWKRQVEQITEADNELMASKVLGVDWQDQVASQSVNIMTTYGNEYASYNNRLKNQVEVEIAQTEKVINERDKEIEEWKDYKNDISNLNESIETSNDAYLKSLNNLVLDENSTWEDRINHLKRNVEIIKQLNAEAESANLTQFDSGMYTLYQGDELVGWGYSSAEEAERERRKLAENIAKNRTPSNAPAGVLESIIQSIMNSMHIKKYARGGVNTTTGLSWLDGTKGSSEVVFNAAQAKQLYDIVHNGEFGKMMGENILSGLRDVLGQIRGKNSGQPTPSVLNISFPNANINAESYESFKGFMDKYTNDLFMQLQTGKK